VTGQVERIPLKVDVKRIIEVLAAQIYQSPLALLRENAQNAFDAILLRIYRGDDFEPAIDIVVEPSVIRIADNGIGMTYSDIQSHFWQAGASSKNTPEARDAGVVGTFGIGAMANFGIASELRVVTESAVGSERTETRADRETLSTQNDCIEISSQLAMGQPGTEVVATIDESSPVDVGGAIQYISDFVRHLDIPVMVNGHVVSQQPLDALWPAPTEEWKRSERVSLSGDLTGHVELRVTAAGQLWVNITELQEAQRPVPGRIVLNQGSGQLQTFRSGFGLATVTVASSYNFGGAVDLSTLQPTAGREALSTASMQFLQDVVTKLETWASEQLGQQPASDQNAQFIEWARRHQRFDLCGYLNLKLEPSGRSITLREVKERTSKQPMQFYAGSDNEVVRAIATDESPLLVGAQRNPRRACEQGYLSQYCDVATVEEGPRVIEVYEPGSRAVEDLAIAHRVSDTVERDYFLPCSVVLGRISHGVPVVVTSPETPVEIILDPDGQSFGVLRQLYETEYTAFGSFAKDFVRSVVFPRIETLVPSSTREGAEAFLTRIRSRRHLFEYELEDRQELGSIWEDYYRGDISFDEAARRSRAATQGSVQVVRSPASVSDVAPDLISNQELLPEGETGQPAPAILRPDVTTDASILTIARENFPLKGFRCFLAVSERVTAEKGDFFLQPHSTSVVWGGQKVLFVFQHHSGAFGLYYDIQSDELVSEGSGGGEYVTSTLMLGERFFIPVPEEAMSSFIPGVGRTKRLEIRADVLHSRS
jgi:molecular chaperone HtpG